MQGSRIDESVKKRALSLCQKSIAKGACPVNKSLTIHDIAKMAGVSSATVSRVLSNSTYPVSAANREKILRIAKETNYVPNLLGKQLKTNTNMTLAAIIPSITNPFYSSVVLGIEEIARENRYQVLLCNSLQDARLEDEYVKSIFEKQVKGLIISSLSADTKLLKRYIAKGLHVVALDQKLEEEGILQIKFDYRKGGYLAATHLIESGHRRIAYVTSPLDRPSRRSICHGYEEALREHGLAPTIQIAESEEIYDGVYEFDNGKRLTRRLLELSDRPTAILACNDMTAVGVMNELMAAGVQVPRDMSVMGFDDIAFSRMTVPPLTTVKQPDYEMGRLACQFLMDRLSGKPMPQMEIMLQPKLVIRESVAAPLA